MSNYSRPFFDSDADNTAQVLVAGRAQLNQIHAINNDATDAFVQLFNVAAADVTVGTTTPDYVIYVPASGAVIIDFAWPVLFETALTYECTTTATGNTDPTTGLTLSGTFN